MNMKKWVADLMAAPMKKPLPVLSFPGLAITGDKVIDAVTNGVKQAAGVVAIANRYKMAGAVTFMDLSVEAEAFGSTIRFSDDEIPTVSGRILTSMADVEALAIPEVGSARTGECLKAMRLAKEQIKDRPVFAGHIGPYSLTGRLMDMTEMMVGMSEEPEMVHAALEKATQFLIAYAKVIKETGCDGILMAEPAAGLISPDQSAEFSFAYVKRIIDAVQDDNFGVILHNCGNTVGMVRHMAATGAMGLHFGNAVDMRLILPQVPPTVLAFGNLDPARIIRNGTPEAIREGVARLREIGAAYPNYVVSSGCDIPPATSFTNIDAFFEAALKE
jgi:uroporphyrinogen decarboxylase